MNLQATLEALRRGADARLLRLVALELGGALPSFSTGEMLDLQAGLADAEIRGGAAMDEAARSTLEAVLTGALQAEEQQGHRDAESAADLALIRGARKPWRQLLAVAKADEALRPSEMAAEAGMDPSVASKELGKLCEAGFFEDLDVDPRLVDNRGRFYRLTGRGERLAEKLRSAHAETTPWPQPAAQKALFAADEGTPYTAGEVPLPRRVRPQRPKHQARRMFQGVGTRALVAAGMTRSKSSPGPQRTNRFQVYR